MSTGAKTSNFQTSKIDKLVKMITIKYIYIFTNCQWVSLKGVPMGNTDVFVDSKN